jgi:hypothetical protein
MITPDASKSQNVLKSTTVMTKDATQPLVNATTFSFVTTMMRMDPLFAILSLMFCG